MVKPILLNVHPTHLDYPLFRYNLKRFEKYFASVWFAMSNHHQEVDYTNFLRAQFPEAHFVDYSGTWPDWRNGAINEALDQIKTNEPILFMEQDFLIKDDSFFEKVLKDEYPLVYFTEGDRAHPAFALVQRGIIEKTSRDFSANPPAGDHFYKFFQEIPMTGIYLEELGVKNKQDYYHLNGLSQNYMNFKNNAPFYREEDFLYYVHKCLQLPLPMHPQFEQIHKAIERTHGHSEKHPFLDTFFP